MWAEPTKEKRSRREIKRNKARSADNKKRQAVKVNQNAKHFRTRSVRGWALTADFFTQSKIQNDKE